MTTSNAVTTWPWWKPLRIIALIVAVILLVATGGFVFWESTWVKTENRNLEQSFLYGMTGTEIMPLPVLQVLPDLFPDQFQPGGSAAGDWVQQFGFNPGTPGVNAGLPLGFSLTNYRPKSGSPSPVKFVGVSCALCHSATLKTKDTDPGVFIQGMGNPSLNFIAWVDAVRTIVLDEKRLTPQAINVAYEQKFHRALSLPDQLMIRVWLATSRDLAKSNLPKIDAPFSGEQLRNAAFMPNGPARTQPFRNLIRNIMNRPATTDKGYSKFPVLYHQKDHEWGQFDGSVGNPLTRSVLAAIATGATIDNLQIPDVAATVTQSVAYTLDLPGPKLTEIFPNVVIDSAKAERGAVVYQQHCSSCHGSPGLDGNWVKGARQGEVVPVMDIQTDAERLNFRYYEVLADYLYTAFPKNHPLKKHPLQPKREDLRPGPLGRTKGYINSPIESAFSHAPYLHNGSIPTLAELINLKPRRSEFYRGSNLYDVVDVGLVVPDRPDALRYFKFDTHAPGNSNQGHNYPWPYQGAGWDAAALADLLEYLKTI